MRSTSKSAILAAVPLAILLIVAGNLLALLDRPVEVNPGNQQTHGPTTGPGGGGTSGNFDGGAAGGTGGIGGSTGGGGGSGGTGAGGTGGTTGTGGGTGGGTGTGNGTGTDTGTGTGGGASGSGNTGGSGGNVGSGGTSTGGGSTSDGRPGGGSITIPPPPRLDFLLWVLLGVLAILGALLAYRFLRRWRSKPKVTAKSQAKASTPAGRGKAALVQQLMATEERLAVATNIREEIIQAYRHIHSTLQGRGIGDPPCFTCWDFHRAAARTFRPAGTPFAHLTSVFEEARYSRHDLTEAHRQRALAAVRDVMASL